MKELIKMYSILFISADPTDAARLRLGEEVREIQEKLQLAKLRDRFALHQRASIRPVDLTQALLDLNPQIVHFSGHGTPMGELCFEDEIGKTHPVPAEGLAGLFEQFANQVKCVVLNACYSETQAESIVKHIDYVVGMEKAIGDKAAIAFSVGFYQALGAGRSFEDAYKLGRVQIKLRGISEDLTPVLMRSDNISAPQTSSDLLVEKDSQPTQSPKPNKSSLNMRRLEVDYRRILNLISESQGRIEIVETVGQPPDVYVFKFRCQTIVYIDIDGQPIWSNETLVKITLHERYPIWPAMTEVISPMFHPQVKNNSLCAGWSNAQGGLDILVEGLFQIVAFHNYSLVSPLNSEAARWYSEHPEIIKEIQVLNSDDVEWLERKHILTV